MARVSRFLLAVPCLALLSGCGACLEATPSSGKPLVPTDAGDLGDAGGGDAADAIESDGGVAGDSSDACTSDGECELGELCIQSACAAGCRDSRDCPAVSPACALDAAENGLCVQCTDAAAHCAPSEVCADYGCRIACATENVGCTDGVCDVEAGYCVGCLEDSHCPTGEICEGRSCIEGCRDDRDCPEGLICDDNQQCVGGCDPVNDTCPVGAHCDVATRSCVVGCNGDDDRCLEGDVCVDEQGGAGWRCRAACDNDNPCPADRTCLAGVCRDGCQSSDDCTSLAAPVCDETIGTPGRCVACLVDEDCPGVSQGVTCNVPARTCVAPCVAFSQGATPSCPLGGVCEDGIRCVECLADADCGDDAVCDLVTKTCLEAPVGLCGSCGADEDCVDGGLCHVVAYGSSGLVGERVCGIDCTDVPCPQGFACTFIGTPVRGKQCVPASTVLDFPTCAAWRDAVEQQECSFNLQCGAAGYNDSFCVDVAGDGLCVLPCGADVDCPADYQCEDPPPDVNIAGICMPPD
ncbi:MAG: hypothetical protein ACO3JL_04775 [Myxococcota bacterium]